MPEEYRFDVLLDHGWAPATPADANVFALNTAQRINEAISPHNAIHFGIGDGGIGSARLDTRGRIWGGPASAVIHVEVDAWFERGRMLPRCQPTGSPPICMIDDWVTIPEVPTPGLYWPFNPADPPGVGSGPLRLGDYVRLVGTLWEDTAHIDGGGKGGDRGQDAKACWCKRETGNCRDSGRGWFELHPVDYMARIEPPAASSATLEVLALCGESSIAREIAPPGRKPTPGSTVGFEEWVDAAFSEPSQVTKTVTVLPASVRVDLAARRGAGDRARFKAVYRVFWLDENGATVPAFQSPPLPPQQPLALHDVRKDSCGAESLVIDTPRPRKFVARGESLGITPSGSTIEWSCGPRAPLQSLETTRCDRETIAVKITRAATGDEFTTECIGPE